MNDIDAKIRKVIIESHDTVIKQKDKREILPNSPNPLALSKWVAKRIEFICNEIDIIENNNELKCTCSKGCTACCKQPIVISVPEALTLKPYISNLSKEGKTALHKNVSMICKKIEDSGFDPHINNFGNKEIVDDYMRKYFALNINCVMLNENGECLIYSVRPSSCWSYRSYENPNECEKSHSISRSIKFDDWEEYFLLKLFNMKKIRYNSLKLLPYHIKDILEYKL